MSDGEYTGPCKGGPHDGQRKTYGAARMPVLASGADTEGQLLGYYVYQGGGWQWHSDTQPDGDDRVR